MSGGVREGELLSEAWSENVCAVATSCVFGSHLVLLDTLGGGKGTRRGGDWGAEMVLACTAG